MRPSNDLSDERKIGEYLVIVMEKLYRQMLDQRKDICQSIKRWRFDSIAKANDLSVMLVLAKLPLVDIVVECKMPRSTPSDSFRCCCFLLELIQFQVSLRRP
jgi:hypothetical protein